MSEIHKLLGVLFRKRDDVATWRSELGDSVAVFIYEIPYQIGT